MWVIVGYERSTVFWSHSIGINDSWGVYCLYALSSRQRCKMGWSVWIDSEICLSAVMWLSGLNLSACSSDPKNSCLIGTPLFVCSTAMGGWPSPHCMWKSYWCRWGAEWWKEDIIVKSGFLKPHILAVGTVSRPSDRNNSSFIGVVAPSSPECHM